MPLRDKYHQRMLLHLDQRLRQLKTVGWHLDIEQQQIEGFFLHLQFAQKFIPIHVSLNVKAALHIVLLDALNNACLLYTSPAEHDSVHVLPEPLPG